MKERFSEDDKAKILNISNENLRRLREESQSTSSAAIRSWVQQKPLSCRDTERCKFFNYTGFLKVEMFSDATECQLMKETMAELVRTEWDPERNDQLDSFGTDQAQNVARGDYFLDSCDKVHFFAEPAALVDGGKLAPFYQQGDNKIAALNKAGHGLHVRPGPFHEYCISQKIRSLVTELGWSDPVVPQSMYIFKQPVMGGAVNSHQDSTFLFTTPKQTCLGLWLALDDATLDNGCLWVRPKSHHEAVRRQYKRNHAHFVQCIPGSSKFVMEELYKHDCSWDGELPDDPVQAGFIPVPCKAGDLLVFNGELDHLSLPNISNQPRHTFQLHLVEGENVEWSADNWLQYPVGISFLRLSHYQRKVD